MIATACYLIDVLCMRVGDEKDPDEADTVGVFQVESRAQMATLPRMKVLDVLREELLPALHLAPERHRRDARRREDDEGGDHHVGQEGDDEDPVVEDPVEPRPHGAEDGVVVAEADLRFCRVHVDIHLCRVDLNEDDCHRVASRRHQRVIGLDHGVGQAIVLNPASVDVENDLVAIGPV